MPRKYMPRLSISEWRNLGEASAILNVLAQTIQATKWAPGPLALEGIKRVYETVAELYNKAEPAALRIGDRRRAHSPGEAPAEGGASAAADSDPGAKEAGAR